MTMRVAILLVVLGLAGASHASNRAWYVVDATEFTTGAGGQGWSSQGGSLSTTEAGTFHAPVRLPIGSTIETLECFLSDLSNADDGYVSVALKELRQLYESGSSGRYSLEIARVDTDTSPGAVTGYVHLWDDANGNSGRFVKDWTVANVRNQPSHPPVTYYSYVLSAFLGAPDDEGTFNPVNRVYIHQCVIEYTPPN